MRAMFIADSDAEAERIARQALEIVVRASRDPVAAWILAPRPVIRQLVRPSEDALDAAIEKLRATT